MKILIADIDRMNVTVKNTKFDKRIARQVG